MSYVQEMPEFIIIEAIILYMIHGYIHVIFMHTEMYSISSLFGDHSLQQLDVRYAPPSGVELSILF